MKSATKTATLPSIEELLQKIVARRYAIRPELVTAERFYDYSYRNEKQSIYLDHALRGDKGTYVEQWPEITLHGTLTYISSDPIFLGNGYRYKGWDELGEVFFFFGSEDTVGDGTGYIVAWFLNDQYNEKDPWGALLVTRTDAYVSKARKS